MSNGKRVEFWHLCDSDRVFASSPYLRIATFPHLGMLTLAAILRAAGFSVRYRDRAYEALDEAELATIIEQEPLFIGLYSNIALKADAVQTIRRIRRRSAKLPIIIGGPGHFDAEEYFQAGASAVVAGMADLIIAQLAERFYRGVTPAGLPGVRLPGDPPDGGLAPFPEDVDRLPFPAWDLAPPGRFRNDLAFIQKNPWYVMLASRGCPYRCHFCSRIYPSEGRRYRLRSPNLVVEEMVHLHRRFGVRHIKFQDDTFGGERQWLQDFCGQKITAALPVEWNCSSSPLSFAEATEEIFHLLRRAGCTSLHFGLQSSLPEMLERIGRSPREPELLQGLAPALRRAGLYALVDLIIGLPGETKATIAAHGRFLDRLPVGMVQVFPLQVVPHTQLARDYPNGEECGLTRAEIDSGVRRITRRFMLRPSVVWRNLSYIARHNPGYLLTLGRLLPYLLRLAFGRYRMARYDKDQRAEELLPADEGEKGA